MAVLALGLALVRLAPARWPSVLGGVVLASVAVCGYALLSKVFPSGLAHDEVYARLREPFGYWNAVGLTAAMGCPAASGWARAARSRARHGAGLPGPRAPAGRPAPGLLARLAARPGRRAGAVVRGRAAAPARRGRAGHERGGRGARRPVGLRPARPERGQGRPRGAHGGRLGVRARPAGARRRPARRRPGRRLRDGHAGAAALGPSPGRRRGARGRRPRAGRGARGPRALRARAGRLDLQGLEGPHRPQRAGDERRPAPDRARQRARAVLGRGAARLPGGQLLGAGRTATRPPGGATAAASSTCATPTATPCRRWPTSGPSAWACRSRCWPRSWPPPGARPGCGGRRGVPPRRPSGSGS